MSDYESEEVNSEPSDYSNLDALEHSYGDDLDLDDPLPEQQDEEEEFEVREMTEAMREKEDYFRRLQREEERYTPVPAHLRQSLDVLSKYEKAKILGLRASQIAKNAPLYVDVPPEQLQNLSALQIAEEELKLNAIPFVLRRYLPDGSYEDWPLSELQQFN